MENQAAKIFFICFSFDNSIANISLYALSCPKFNFAYYFLWFKFGHDIFAGFKLARI